MVWLEIHIAQVNRRRWRAGIAYSLSHTHYAHARFWWLALWRAWRKGRGV